MIISDYIRIEVLKEREKKLIEAAYQYALHSSNDDFNNYHLSDAKEDAKHMLEAKHFGIVDEIYALAELDKL